MGFLHPHRPHDSAALLPPLGWETQASLGLLRDRERCALVARRNSIYTWWGGGERLNAALGGGM